jgi:hypothetical protein
MNKHLRGNASHGSVRHLLFPRVSSVRQTLPCDPFTALLPVSARTANTVRVGYEDNIYRLEWRERMIINLLCKAMTSRINQQGHRDVYTVEREKDTLVDPEERYEARLDHIPLIAIHVKQERVRIEQSTTIDRVSARLSDTSGMPRWSFFKLVRVNGDIRRLAEGEVNSSRTAYTFEWKDECNNGEPTYMTAARIRSGKEHRSRWSVQRERNTFWPCTNHPIRTELDVPKGTLAV